MALFIKGRDFISLDAWSDEECAEILNFARELKSRWVCGEELALLPGVHLYVYDPDRVLPAWDPFGTWC